jgi:acyl-CoA reductase-like NAD-dependent aldehyde dehydrogenase
MSDQDPHHHQSPQAAAFLAGGVIPVFDPATEKQISAVAGAQPADIDLAVAATRRAFERGPWRAMTRWPQRDELDQKRRDRITGTWGAAGCRSALSR